MKDNYSKLVKKVILTSIKSHLALIAMLFTYVLFLQLLTIVS
ncbi:hypothetical protein J2W95_001678 [Flavobacterium granuli]|uniref:Uncharacterized protein n=1 Tax=Flavobacterium granuli TaxID=280093 RepID=A0ABU1S1V7_9FLAO|nr:hypothetical protein [Flavobacterium granuli]